METRGETVNCSYVCSCRLIAKAKDKQEICCTTTIVTHQSETIINTFRKLPLVCPVNNLHHSLSITQVFSSILTFYYLLIQESWGLSSVFSWCMHDPSFQEAEPYFVMNFFQQKMFSLFLLKMFFISSVIKMPPSLPCTNASQVKNLGQI